MSEMAGTRDGHVIGASRVIRPRTSPPYVGFLCPANESAWSNVTSFRLHCGSVKAEAARSNGARPCVRQLAEDRVGEIGACLAS